MAANGIVVLLLTLISAAIASAQLPNIRIGLPRDEDSLRRVNSQTGYEVTRRDIPFGERFKVQFTFNAYWTANAALHPYWFKEFGLDRWCRQDVCLSIWTEDHSHDLMWKVTDVCDPKDCPTPLDVKVEPYKGKYLWYGNKGSRPRVPVYMYFVKCWADGLPQPDLVNTLPGPNVVNSRHWMIKTTREQWERNQAYNRANNQPFRPLGMLVRPWATQFSLDDYRASDYPVGSAKKVKPPSWCKKGSSGVDSNKSNNNNKGNSKDSKGAPAAG
eukprot:gene4417-4670_t